MLQSLSYTFVVLTFNRAHLLERLLSNLERFARAGAEIIVVDNAATISPEARARTPPEVILISAPRNLGAAGRNLGFEAATGDIVLCLDDDVFELSADALERLDEIFANPIVGAANFTVLGEGSTQIVNWVHHRNIEQFANVTFETYEITEGAVAFRRSALREVGGYPESFFLSHEGPDLAFRLMNRGWQVIYTPEVKVRHSFATEGRAPWRKYYYDTRNTLWLAARNLPICYGLRAIAWQIAAMLAYAVRDGYLIWWLKGVVDGLRGLPTAWGQRQVLSHDTMCKVRRIDSFRPSTLYMLRRRLFRRGVRM